MNVSQSIKSVKHNAAKSVNRSILKKSGHIGFGVFIVYSSMGEGFRMKAHKNILCAHSETFRLAFSQKNLVEGRNGVYTISEDHMRPKVVRLLLEWMYLQVVGLEKTIFFKTQHIGFFFGFFGFIYIFAQKREFLGFYLVSRILLGASRLKIIITLTN